MSIVRYVVAGRELSFLPDNKAWTNRFEIGSDSSTRVYMIAQGKTNKQWACSCPGWIMSRKGGRAGICKHLRKLTEAGILTEIVRLRESKALRLPSVV